MIRSTCCGAEIRTERVDPVPPPPSAILATVADPPDAWTGSRWVCAACGEVVGFQYDYGKVDLGLVE